MDFQINVTKLPIPKNCIISCPKNNRQLVITWDREIDCYYNIYRGISLNGVFNKINKRPITINRYEDIIGINSNTTYWYKMSTTKKIGDDWIESKLSEPFKYQVINTNRWYKKINERNYWILQNDGELFDLYKRKTEGPRCTKCYDEVRKQSGIIDCDECFGTTYVGGYEPLYQLYVRQKPAQQSIGVNSRGLSQEHMRGAWTISTVEIKNRDILINQQGKMFSVLNCTIGHSAGYLFHQEFNLKELDPTDYLYNLPRKQLEIQNIKIY